MTDILSFVGAVLVGVFGVTGAFAWLRWGWAGVELIWQRRHLIDWEVRDQLKDTINQERK